jgi:ribosomal protein L7/L12
MEEGDKIILKNIPQEEATKAQKKLSENGITVEIK